MTGMRMEQSQDPDDRMVSRQVMQVALLEQQLTQTRIDMGELSLRLSKTDEKLNSLMTAMNEVRGGRTALVWVVSIVAGAASFIAFTIGHWKA